MAFANKRGVSPLIATILLISFAVSLGAVIMNLGVNLSTTVCEDVSIESLVVAEKSRICLDNNQLVFAISNMGPDISGVKVSAIGSSIVEETFIHSISYHESFGDSFDTEQTELDAVQITPIILDVDGELAYCQSKKIELVSIENC